MEYMIVFEQEVFLKSTTLSKIHMRKQNCINTGENITRK